MTRLGLRDRTQGINVRDAIKLGVACVDFLLGGVRPFLNVAVPRYVWRPCHDRTIYMLNRPGPAH